MWWWQGALSRQPQLLLEHLGVPGLPSWGRTPRNADGTSSPCTSPKAPFPGLEIAVRTPWGTVFPGTPTSGSEAVAVPVTEGWLRELNNAGQRPVEELGGASQHSLGLRERLGQLLLPLRELWVTLTLQDKLFSSFYPQQNALFVFNLSFFHWQNLFHCQ